MRSALKLVLAVCVALGPPVAHSQLPAATPKGIDAIRPFRPFLSVNEDAAACDPLLKAWQATYDSASSLDEGEVKLAAAFPGARVTRYTDFYEHPQQVRLDFDGDGSNEVLFFGPNDYSWRYSGPSLYV